MTKPNNKPFDEVEKVKILLQEYATLRSEILTRTSNMFQLFAIAASMLVWIIGRPVDLRFWLAIFILILAGIFFYWLISRDIKKAATRLRELEIDINRRAGEELLVWEIKWGGDVTGYFGRGEPMR